MATLSSQILIAVLGVTGAGKTTFINNAADVSMTVGKGLRSCTQEISYAKARVDGKDVILIDTPGFDDTDKTDADILDNIGTWLQGTYSRDILLTGIILLQPISNNRVYGSEKRRTRLFKKICGHNAFGNVVIASTMWSDLNNEEQGFARVDERVESNDFWGDMVKHGAKVVRHMNNKESAHNIIRILLKKRKRALQMQEELASNGGYLGDTSAALQLHDDLGDLSAKESSKMRKEMNSNRADRAQLMAEIAELRKKVESYENQQQKLMTKNYQNENHSAPAWLGALAACAGVAVTGVAVAGSIFCVVM